MPADTRPAVLLLGLLLAAGCGGGPAEEQQRQLEAVDVTPAPSFDIDNDPQEPDPAAVLVGVLPSDFPADLPLYLPASLVDFGAAGGGRRSVSLLSPHPIARVGPGIRALLAEKGWSNDGQGGFRKGTRQVRLHLENARPGTTYSFEY